ncbi:MAG: hypothetical protein ACI4F4_08915 [Lachnospiraceae bacterium]
MYQNKKKTWIYLGICLACFIPIGFNFVIMMFTLLLYATNQIPSNHLDLPVVGIIVSLFGCLTFILFFQIRKYLRVGKISRYLEVDDNGLVAISDLSHFMKRKQKKVVSDFLDFVGKGVLVNCMIFQEDPTYILLDNGKETVSEKYVVLHCRKCGAPSTLRIGFEHQCKYCGAQFQEMKLDINK